MRSVSGCPRYRMGFFLLEMQCFPPHGLLGCADSKSAVCSCCAVRMGEMPPDFHAESVSDSRSFMHCGHQGEICPAVVLVFPMAHEMDAGTGSSS